MKKGRMDYLYQAEITVTAEILIDTRDGSCLCYKLDKESIKKAVDDSVTEQLQNMGYDDEKV